MKKRTSKQLYIKLLILYAFVVCLVVLVLVFYFINSTQRRYLEKNKNYMELMHNDAVNYLNSCGENAGHIHEELYNSSMEMNDIIHYLEDSPQEYQQYRLDLCTQYEILDYKGIEDFSLTAFETYSSLLRLTFISYQKQDVTYFVGSQSLYHEEEAKTILEDIQENHLAKEGEISFLKEIRNPITLDSVGAMIITFDGTFFEQIQEKYHIADLVVYGNEEVPIYTSGEAAKGGYILNSKIGEYSVLTSMNKKEASHVPLTVIFMGVGAGGLIMILSIFFIQFYLKKVSLRLNHILDGMSEVMGGNLSVRLPIGKREDELDLIALHFNEMCEKLDLYIQKFYLAEIEQKNAEMEALQSQINPHFLYNTLEAVRMKAICNGDKETGEMLYSMAVIFRSMIKESDVITLVQELHYCKKYLELFEYRYPGQFHSNVECPIEYFQVPIIKFVLQPVIENYFAHGIRRRDKDNFVSIKVLHKNEVYEIILEDNGRGISDERMEELNTGLKENKKVSKQSIGIFNVNRRIKAVYGNHCGLRLEKSSLGGTKVILTFRPEEGKENEEGNAC